MSRIVDIEPLLKKYDGMNEGTEFSPIHFINDLMALEQLLFTEKEELLRVGKGTVKARQGRFVIYDVDWLKKNFYSTEEKIYGQPKQPCEDCISRESVRKILVEAKEYGSWDDSSQINRQDALDYVDMLPSVTPTSEAIKEAYDKGYEYGVKEWFEKHTKDQTCIEDYPTCTECEHYDSEKHYCPRFCQVIKDTLAEAQPCEDVVKCDCTTEEIAKSFIEDVEAVKEQLDGQPSEDCISILNRIMEYTYGMLTSEKIGLQHLIKSMMDEMNGGGEDGEDSACD